MKSTVEKRLLYEEPKGHLADGALLSAHGTRSNGIHHPMYTHPLHTLGDQKQTHDYTQTWHNGTCSLLLCNYQSKGSPPSICMDLKMRMVENQIDDDDDDDDDPDDDDNGEDDDDDDGERTRLIR